MKLKKYIVSFYDKRRKQLTINAFSKKEAIDYVAKNIVKHGFAVELEKRDLNIKEYTQENGTKVIKLPEIRMGETMFCGVGAKKAVILSSAKHDIVDYRRGKKVVLTLTIEDKGQDFTELDVLENGVILGNSIMFSHGRVSLIGAGTLDGMKYSTRDQILQTKLECSFFEKELKGSFIYIKNTEEKDPLPWNARTLNYRITGVKEPVNPDRFIKTN